MRKSQSKNKNAGTGGKGKGTYGRLPSRDGGSGGKKQKQRSSLLDDMLDASLSSRRKKAKSSVGAPPSGKNGKQQSSSSKPGKKKKASKAGGGSSSGGNKVVPKSKHHSAKPGKNSIKERVAKASNGRKSTKMLDRLVAKAPKRKKKGGGSKRGKGARQRYRMSLSACNDDVYLRRADVPWHDAEVQERTFNDGDYEDDDISDAGGETNAKIGGEVTTLQYPSESILRQLDSEIQSFGRYVKLTPSEQKARQAFLDHVAELAVAQFENSSSYGNSHIRFGQQQNQKQQKRRGSGSRRGGAKSFHLGAPGGPSSLDDFKDVDEEEEIHVAPFGSFATQDVCIFASDVDMCLWGVVEGAAKKPSSAEDGIEFVGSEDSDGGDGREESDVVVLGKDSHCPLLTESSLLRTMDALQSASAAREKSPSKEQDDVADAAEMQVQNGDGKAGGECLFFIDREGEPPQVEDDAKSAEVIDLCATDGPTEKENTSQSEASKGDDSGATAEAEADVKKPPNAVEEKTVKGDDKPAILKGDEMERHQGNGLQADPDQAIATTDKAEKQAGKEQPAESGETSTKKDDDALVADFQFVIDTQGVKELGGEVEDVEDPPDDSVHVVSSSPQQAGKESKGICKPQSPGDAGQKPGGSHDDSTKLKEGEGDDLEPGTFSALGKSAQDAIDINDDSSDDDKSAEVIIVDSDDDSADKMSSYYNRSESGAAGRRRNRTETETRASPVILLDDDSSSEVEIVADDSSVESIPTKTARASNNEVLELSLTSNNNPQEAASGQPMKKPSFGPTGKARVRVISALQSLTRQLRRSSFTHTIECRSKARVPIINCSTRTGFEGDIAIGGHNGVDTSHYALAQVKRFRSFAPIVLLFKVLMAQQGFDKPFTGGVGSYKLYVLVAYHIERHVANGGTDRASEILISLLFRYGCISSEDDKDTTDLEQLRNRDSFVSSQGGMCELNPVFRLSDCVDMFRECHSRLFERFELVSVGDSEKISYLSSIIDCYKLREARETSHRRSKMCDNICRPVQRNDAGKVNAGKRIGHVFSKSGGPHNAKPKRGPRGSILPSYRPDLQAKKALRGKRDAEVIQRGLKNRKNKKKQSRDVALKSFASRQHSI